MHASDGQCEAATAHIIDISVTEGNERFPEQSEAERQGLKDQYAKAMQFIDGIAIDEGAEESGPENRAKRKKLAEKVAELRATIPVDGQ